MNCTSWESAWPIKTSYVFLTNYRDWPGRTCGLLKSTILWVVWWKFMSILEDHCELLLDYAVSLPEDNVLQSQLSELKIQSWTGTSDIVDFFNLFVCISILNYVANSFPCLRTSILSVTLCAHSACFIIVTCVAILYNHWFGEW